MGTVLLKRVQEVDKDTLYFMDGHSVTEDQYMAAYRAASKLNLKGATGSLNKAKEKHTVALEAVNVPEDLIIAAPVKEVAEAPTDAEPVAKEKAKS